MTAVRFLLVVACALVLLVAGMMSATILHFEPGAWVAFGAFFALVAARIGGWFGWLPDGWDFEGD
jgi:hypothetical protein